MNTIFDKPLIGYRFVEIQYGDTLQSIAARELQDATRWPELISFNDLRPPYIAAVASAGVLRYGDQILIPAPTPVISTTSDPERVFEADIALTKGKLIAVDGDFAVVAGRPNLHQALRHRVETERGELLFHPEYGSFVRRLIGAVNGPTSSLLAAQYAKSAVLMDPRVATVTQATAEVSGDTIRVSIELQPVAGRPFQLTAAP